MNVMKQRPSVYQMGVCCETEGMGPLMAQQGPSHISSSWSSLFHATS